MTAAALAGLASAKLPPAIIRARRDNIASLLVMAFRRECKRKQAAPQLCTQADFDQLDCVWGGETCHQAGRPVTGGGQRRFRRSNRDYPGHEREKWFNMNRARTEQDTAAAEKPGRPPVWRQLQPPGNPSWNGRFFLSGRAVYAARSFTLETPNCLAQWAQQKVLSSVSTPWPMMRQPQCAHRGAMASIAHSKLSNVMLRGP